MKDIKVLFSEWNVSPRALYAEDADLMDKQKKQTLNPHIELRECFFPLWPFVRLRDVPQLVITRVTSTLTLSGVEFSDASAKFYCRIYYAEEFHKMREEIMESPEEDFVRSLSHCVNWQARGGKSGAVFYATEGFIRSWYNVFMIW